MKRHTLCFLLGCPSKAHVWKTWLSVQQYSEEWLSGSGWIMGTLILPIDESTDGLLGGMETWLTELAILWSLSCLWHTSSLLPFFSPPTHFWLPWGEQLYQTTCSLYCGFCLTRAQKQKQLTMDWNIKLSTNKSSALQGDFLVCFVSAVESLLILNYK